MNIFKKCPYIDYRYVLSIYGPPLPEEDDGQAEGAQASWEDRVELVPNVTRVAVAKDSQSRRMHLQILWVVQVVKGINKRCIEPFLCAFSAAKLSQIVRDVLEKDTFVRG